MNHPAYRLRGGKKGKRGQTSGGRRETGKREERERRERPHPAWRGSGEEGEMWRRDGASHQRIVAGNRSQRLHHKTCGTRQPAGRSIRLKHHLKSDETTEKKKLSKKMLFKKTHKPRSCPK